MHNYNNNTHITPFSNVYIGLVEVGNYCPNISVDNGEVMKTGLEVGSHSRYVCAKGFTLIGAPVRECQEDFTWSGKDAVCQGIKFIHKLKL